MAPRQIATPGQAPDRSREAKRTPAGGPAPGPGCGGPALPDPAGPLSEALFDALLSGRPGASIALPRVAADGAAVLADDDFQLALYALYELHYRGFRGVDERWEWDAKLIGLCRDLEEAFEEALRGAVARDIGVEAAEMDLALRAILESDHGPSLSRHLERHASLEQFREFAVHRSAYQLKEADPHSWALPRLAGAPKAALVAIQADEYGEGVPERAHCELFRGALLALGLDGDYGAYLSLLPGVTLATVNLMTLFGLHRRWRGAIVGHLAAFEMSSAIPNGRYSRGVDRLGVPGAKPFYDEHVVADSVHENLAAVDLAGGMVRAEPHLAGDILFGARALVELDRRFADALLEAWERGESSLRESLPTSATPDGGARPAIVQRV